MKGDFNEGLQSSKRDPVDAENQDFDWQGLYRRLNEDAHDGDNDQRLAEAVMRLLQMLVPQDPRRIQVLSLGLNLVALAWVLNPAYFDGSPSLTQLARRCGVEPASLGRHTGHFSRLLRWRNRGQRHAWNWHVAHPAAPSTSSAKKRRTARNGAGASKREKAPKK